MWTALCDPGMTFGLSVMARLLLLAADTLNERGDVFRPPDGRARAEFDRLGVAPGTAALPPYAFADGKDGQNLGQAEKAGCRNGSKHVKSSF